MCGCDGAPDGAIPYPDTPPITDGEGVLLLLAIGEAP
jgi:hypothetical protein